MGGTGERGCGVVQQRTRWDLIPRIEEYRKKILDRRDGVALPHAERPFWYPYDTLAGLKEAAEWLEELLHVLRNRRMLDLGCGDGLSSFFFESLGFAVDAVDHAETNFNGMRGARLLAELLGSQVRLFDIDLDGVGKLPGDRYGLVLCLGLLYHVENPFWLLQTLSRASSYCLLSTRIARLAPDGTKLERLPVAYLADAREVNGDSSNYWVFSMAGLERLAARTGWELSRVKRVGDLRHSNPSSPDRDERAVCLLKSRFRRVLESVELLDGWHALENRSWRWTARHFALSLRGLSSRLPARIPVRFFAPEVLLAGGPVRLEARVDGRPAAVHEVTASGQQEFFLQLPLEEASGVRVEFELSRAIPPDDSDSRERGVIFEFFRVSAAEEWSPIEC